MPGTAREVRRSVLLVEDHPLTRIAAATALRDAGWHVVACGLALEGSAAMGSMPFDVALVDLDLPDRPGVWLVRQIRMTHPELPVAALTATVDEARILEVLDAGASGYLSKMVDVVDLPTKVAALAAGDEVFDDVAASRLIRALRGPRPTAAGRLTAREVEVLALLADGADTAELAATLHISPHTAKDAVRSIFRKLDVHDRAAAVAEGFRRGILS